MDECGSKAVDVGFGGMAPAQNHLGAHVYLKETRKASFIWLPSARPVLEAGSSASVIFAACSVFQMELYFCVPQAKEDLEMSSRTSFPRSRSDFKEPRFLNLLTPTDVL